MKIVQPEVNIWQQGEDRVAHVARCARVCYGKETGDDHKLYRSLAESKHLSMFRHETYYAAVPAINDHSIVYLALDGYRYSPYIKWVTFGEYCYIVTNGQFMRDIQNSNPVLNDLIYRYQITISEALKVKEIRQHFARYTFCITTQISTSRELNRVSPNNISEQSTRYVYENGTICKPHWMNEEDVNLVNTGNIFLLNSATSVYIKSCNASMKNYKSLIDNYDFKKEDARGVLPLDTATKCVYTYSIDEWRNIINLRYYGVTGKPHPNAKLIVGMIREKLIDLGCCLI